MTDKQTVVVSAFPGTGKTYAAENCESYSILDADSSSHSWASPGIRNPDFPQNYIEYVRKQIGKYDIIFVSSHQIVRDMLSENVIPFLLIHPLKEDKSIYIQRFKERGDNEKFIKMLDTKWDAFIDSMYTQLNYSEITILLTTGAYVSDYIDGIASRRGKKYV